ncbi:hypothetical protein [Pseudonocardia humida]|uniref:Uncharacterized protein n=1 Tax=Pseudonocardia humida TaxID=2800819 RepID=A0ABT0ZXB3_9PSEU|nr:hypothetical protein [Pseudonocardia humida]MCO1655264.1 hypothetical protein [Pseudonocardia humida]
MSAAAAAALREVVRRYGGSALGDPVALRSALRHLDADLPAGEVDALVAVAAAGAADELRGSGGELGAAVEAVGSRADLPVDDVRAACAAFAAALHPIGAPAAPPADRGGRAGPRITWDGTPTRPAPATGPPRRRRLALVLGAVLLVVTAVAVVVGRPAASPAAADPSAPDQVALRFRALGADLVRGVLRCAPLAPEPGETERVRCDFGGLAVELVGYDSPNRLRGHRDEVLAATRGSARSADAVEAGAAFVMDETAEGRSTVYWDVESPRPMSATVSASRPLAEVLAFHDERRFAALPRPEQPGPAFGSAALWELAAVVVADGGGECAPTAREEYFAGTVEQVSCTFPNGVLADFARVADGRALTAFRVSSAFPEYTVPGTVRTGSWSDVDDTGAEQTQLIEYVLAADGDSYLYYDRRETLCLGLLYHPDLGQAELREFFVSRGLQR